jgi:hypothetical protein
MARTPFSQGWESWLDRQIREAEERGEFKNLPGIGKPIEGLDQPFDDMWWLRGLMKREDLQYLPETLQLRKDIEAELERIARMREEHRVREALAALNARIEEANRRAVDGPPLNMAPFDVDSFITRWKTRR